jgi:cytochrome P450
VQFIVGSAVETTRKLLANMFQMLLQRPDAYTSLRSNPALVPMMVEETLRYYSPVQSTIRRCVRDTTVTGVQVKKGESVHAAIGSANRDEAVFSNPDEFRFDRESPRGHLGFGAGPHVCPGAALARLEATVALQVFTERISQFTPVRGAYYGSLPSVGLHSPTALLADLCTTHGPATSESSSLSS